MQTFLPYADLRGSCQVLDGPRLGKQRVEVFQVLRALTWPDYAWKNHPAVRMWRGFVPGLVLYGVESCREWVRRGGGDSLLPQLLAWTGDEVPVDPPLPPWFGTAALHRSHRSSLLRKDPAFYRPVFGPDEPDDLPYFWPPDLWPRWPARRGDRPADLTTALAALGLPAPRPGQAAAVEAVRAGRDCLAVLRPGSGATTTGLLAALATDGTTTLVVPPLGPVETCVPQVALLPARQTPGATSPAIARPPSTADLLAMAEEQRPPEVVVRVGCGAAGPADGLLVLDGAEVVRAGPGPRPPVLALVPRAGPQLQAHLVEALGLVDPVHVGGGWDPAATYLAAVAADSAAAARRALGSVVRQVAPCLVLVADRTRADQVVTALRGADLRAAAWDGRRRADRAAAALADWRALRLDALVVPAGERPALGRARLPALVGYGAPGDQDGWLAAMHELGPALGVLVTGPDAPLADLAAEPGCRRAALLREVGEPVQTPCGRCDVCAPGRLGA